MSKKKRPMTTPNNIIPFPMIPRRREGKIILREWQVVIPKGGVIYEIRPMGCGHFHIMAIYFLDEETDRNIIIPLEQGFDTAEEAFDWLKEIGPIFLNSIPFVQVVDEDGDIVDEWELVEGAEDDLSDNDNPPAA